VQAARKDAGLDVSDRIDLSLDGDPPLIAAAREHEAVIAREVLASSFSLGSLNGEASQSVIDGMALRIALRKA
jgi:isoleucyl-tRNA synthetase